MKEKINNLFNSVMKKVKENKKQVLAITACSVLALIFTFVTYNLSNPTYINRLFANVLNNGTPANTAFEDYTFYTCVVDAYNNKNGASKSYTESLTDEELASITSLTCEGYNYDENSKITSAKGIEKLTGLKKLNLKSNQLTSIDLSNNTALESVYLNNNQLTSIDLKSNTSLTDLSLFGNQLTSIDLSSNTALTYLNLGGNQLTSIDLSNNTALLGVNLNNNQLTSIDLKSNTSLIDLSLFGNQLTSIDLSSNTALTYLNLKGNQLTSIDLSSNTALTYLNLKGNQLTSIDLSNNTALVNVYLNNNQLTQSIPSMLVGDTYTIVDKVILPSNMSMNYKIANSDIAKLDGNIITALSEGNTTLEANYVGTSDIVVKEFKLTSNSYQINNVDKYIYTKNDVDEETIKNKISTNIGEIVIDDDKLKVIRDGTTLDEYTIINYSMSEYKIWNGFIYLVVDNFDSNNIKVTGGDYEINNNDNTLSIKYNDTVLETFKLVIITSSYYDLADIKTGKSEIKYLYLGTKTYDKTKINVTNATIEDNGCVTITDGVSRIPVFTAVSIKFSDGTNKKGKYVYKSDFSSVDCNLVQLSNLGGSKHDSVSGVELTISNNLIELKFGDEVIDSYNIVSFSSSSYKMLDGAIYIGEKDYNSSDITLTNGYVKINKDDKTILDFYSNGGDFLDGLKLVGYKIKDYDTYYQLVIKPGKGEETTNSIYLGLKELDKNKLSLTNCDYEIPNTNNWIYIKYNGNIIDYIKLDTISIDKYTVKNNKIYTKVDRFDSSYISLTNCSNCSVDNTEPYVFKVKHEDAVLDVFENVLINPSNQWNSLANDIRNYNYIYLGTKSIEDLSIDKVYENYFELVNGFYEVEGDKLVIYDSSNKENVLDDSIKLLKISSDKYTLKNTATGYNNDRFYLYAGLDKFDNNERIDTSKIKLSDGLVLSYDNWGNYSIYNTNYSNSYGQISVVYPQENSYYKLTNDYVYYGLCWTDSWRCNNSVNYTNGYSRINENKIDIYTNADEKVDSIKIAKIETEYVSEDNEEQGIKYNFNNNYLYMGTNVFDPTLIRPINLEIEYSSDTYNLVVMYDGKEIETINLISLVVPDKYIPIYDSLYMAEDEFDKSKVNEITSFKKVDKNKINLVNGKFFIETYEEEDDDGNIFSYDSTYICPIDHSTNIEDYPSEYLDRVCIEFNPFSVLSDNYDLNKDYIYTGTDKFNNDFKFKMYGELYTYDELIEESEGSIQLIINDDSVEFWFVERECDEEYVNGEWIYTNCVVTPIMKFDDWKLVSVSSSKYDLNSEKIVLKDDEDLDLDNIKIVNGKALLEDGYLLIKYNDEVIKKIKIEGGKVKTTINTKTTSKKTTSKKTTSKKTTNKTTKSITTTTKVETTTKRKFVFPTTTKITDDIGSVKKKELNMLYKQGNIKLTIIYILILYNILLAGIILLLKNKMNIKKD